MKTIISLTGLLLALLLMPTACGTARRAPTVAEPMTITGPDVERGEAVFMNFCNQCHPGGTAGLGPALNDKPLPGFAIKWQVRDGFGVMPGFKKEVISPEELDDLVVYMKALRRTAVW